MDTVRINKGFTIDTEEGYQVITGKHFSGYAADNFTVDENGNGTKTGTVILSVPEILNRIHEMTGKAYRYLDYEE